MKNGSPSGAKIAAKAPVKQAAKVASDSATATALRDDASVGAVAAKQQTAAKKPAAVRKAANTDQDFKALLQEVAAQSEKEGGSEGGGSGGVSTPLLVVGGLGLVGGGIALAAGGGSDEPANRAPTAVADSNSVAEDATVSGSVRTNDSDPDNDTLTFAKASGQADVAGLTFNADGSYTFDAKNAAYQSLAQGETKDVVFNYTVSDGKGGSANAALTIKVTGTNDAPVIDLAKTTKTLTVVEDGSAEFVIDATDIDNGDTANLTVAVATQPTNGKLVVQDGKNVYVPNKDFNGTDSFVVEVSDGKGGKVSHTVAVTVQAAGETVAIDVVDDTSPTTYAAKDSLGNLDSVTFKDDSSKPTNAVLTSFNNGDVIEVTGASQDYSFTTNGDGDIIITYNNVAASALNQIRVVGLAANSSVNVTDEASAELAAGFDFFKALTQPSGGGAGGVNNLDTDTDANVLTTAVFTATAGVDAYTDDANVANTVRIVSFNASAGDTITVSNASTSDFSFSSVGTDLKISYTTGGGVVNDITLAGVLTANSPLIATEAQAEAALGDDFFRSTAAPAPAGATTLDVGTEASPVNINAGTNAFTFSDDATKGTEVRISNFTADDKIAVTGATASLYSFSSGNFDNGTSGNDLQVSYTTAGGVVNNIIIYNVVSPDALISSEATAEAAVGFNFITFA